MSQFTVLRPTQESEYEFIIVNEDQIEFRSLNNCYDNYGNPLEDDGQEYEVICYHDGHNWRSKFVDENEFSDFKRVEESEGNEILSEFEGASFEEEAMGLRKAQTDRFTFFRSNWQSAFEIAYGYKN